MEDPRFWQIEGSRRGVLDIKMHIFYLLCIKSKKYNKNVIAHCKLQQSQQQEHFILTIITL